MLHWAGDRVRIAFLGLADHARTGSSRFFLDLLARHGEVTAWFAAPAVADVRRRCAGFAESGFDAIVVWQLEEAFALLSGRHPNVTFVPMYDAMLRGGGFAWRPSFNAAKVLCFAWALRQEVMRRAPVHAHAQYFPDPEGFAPVTDFTRLRGLLWYRRRDIPPERVFALTRGTRFASLCIHDAPDPGHAAPGPPVAPPHIGTLARTTWSEDAGAYAAALGAANVYFAPRPLEGIGMAFLEAMARGLCVVAPDAPTMNEVIAHGANGLLYPPGSDAPLDFRAAREMGARARETVERGHARWREGLDGLLDFVLAPTASVAARAGRRGVCLARPAPAAA
ncbi:MAG TPA: glycosyltransferase, partial [Crenalkalicoccus sp.]|nr:glycosyltransferase [Crenalkalicoccus sp.]